MRLSQLPGQQKLHELTTRHVAAQMMMDWRAATPDYCPFSAFDAMAVGRGEAGAQAHVSALARMCEDGSDIDMISDKDLQRTSHPAHPLCARCSFHWAVPFRLAFAGSGIRASSGPSRWRPSG